jgi:hydrogenase maturation protease
MTQPADTVVIGLGDVVLSDDGLGVHAVRRLRARARVADGVELIEGGPAGSLLRHLARARRALIVDAIDAGLPPGAIVRLEGKDWADAMSIRMTPHEVALEDLLGAAELSGAWPEELVLLGAQPGSIALGSEPSRAVAKSLDALVAAIEDELQAWSIDQDGTRCTSSRSLPASSM